VYNAFENFNNQSQKSITFYNIPNATAFNIIQNKEANFYADSLLINDDERFRFHVQQHIWSQGVEQVIKSSIDNSYIVHLSDRKLRIHRGKIELKNLSKNDIILVTKRTFIDFKSINKAAEALFILGSDLSAHKRQYFANKLKELNILFVDLSMTGAHTINL
jgi:hypothetical protein